MTPFRVLVVAVVTALVISCMPISVRGSSLSGQGGWKNFSCILVFGDSSVDPGNNNQLKTSFKANFPPYGMNLFNGQITGRFTNGRLPTDMTGIMPQLTLHFSVFHYTVDAFEVFFLSSAESLGIKSVVPAFLDPKLKKEDLLTGVSFASSGSGYDNFTAQLTNVIPVYKQVEYFRHYKVQLRELVGAKRAEKIVKGALVILSMGTNDFLQNYYLEPTRSKQFTVEQYTEYLTTCMAQDIKEMHRLGATTLTVVGLPPLGCLPLVKTLKGSKECVDAINKDAFSMNSKVKIKLATLRRSLGMEIYYEDIYAIFQRAMRFPKEYGFMETSKGCVGSGMVEVAEMCKGQTTCKHPSNYMFWDAVHPTEKMYKIIADDVTNMILSHLSI